MESRGYGPYFKGVHKPVKSRQDIAYEKLLEVQDKL